MWFGLVLMDSIAPHIEILSIYDLVDQALCKQVAHRGGDTAKAKAHLNATLFHDLSKGDRGCDGCAANTGLVREAILEVRSVDHELGAVICHHNLTDIGGRFCCTGCDLCRVTDFVYHADKVYLVMEMLAGMFGNGTRQSVIATTRSAYCASTIA